jgi:hypothetical protein
MERTISDESQVCSPGWPAFNCNTRLASSGHRGCISRKASAKAWGVMPPGVCDRFCWAAVTAVICKATRWTTTCRASGLGGEKYFVFRSKTKGRRNAYSNSRFLAAQRRTELAVSWSTTNSTSIWPAEGLPTWIAQIPGTLATNVFGVTDDGTCCWLYTGKPITEAGDAVL